MNQRMRSTLGEVSPSDFAKSEKLSEKLSQLLARGFTDLDGAIVFTAMRKIAKNVKPENFPDLTGVECFVNHIHVEDQLDDCNQSALFKQGVTFGLAIERRLRSTFPDKPFKVIIAATAHGCGVRFHLVRPGEEWLASDLDGYRERPYSCWRIIPLRYHRHSDLMVIISRDENSIYSASLSADIRLQVMR